MNVKVMFFRSQHSWFGSNAAPLFFSNGLPCRDRRHSRFASTAG